MVSSRKEVLIESRPEEVCAATRDVSAVHAAMKHTLEDGRAR